MSKVSKVLAMSLILTIIMIISITGTVFAAGGNSDNGNRGEECPYCDCISGDCEPKDHLYNNDNNYASPVPMI